MFDDKKFLNMMNYKIEHNTSFTEKELLMISLLCFMRFEKDIKKVICDSAVAITRDIE